MCGHGTIGTVTMAVENGLVTPATPGVLNLDAPAGRVVARYEQNGRFVESVRITNVAVLSARRATIAIDVPGLGELVFDIAYGGNFYAILEPQKNFAGLETMSAGDVLRLSPIVRRLLNEKIQPVHPENPTITRREPRACGPASRATRAPMRATRCSTATRRSTAPPAAPAPRRAWPSSRPRGRLEGRRRLRA